MKESTLTFLTVPLQRIDGTYASTVGGKAEKLARMLRAGLPVPDGFCVTTTAFDRFLEGVEDLESFYAGLEALTPQSLEPVQAAARQIRQCLAATSIPTVVEAEVLSVWQSQGADRAYAVRSSATAEDLPQASFAGQHDTILNVRGGDALLAAVRQCWLSLFTDRAVLYRMRHQIPHRSAAMAVIIQRMVPSEAAGVVFTAEPSTGNTNRIVIEGTWGLGDAMVSGKVSPDRIVLDKRTLRIVDCAVNRKTTEVVPDTGGGLTHRDVAGERQDQPCVDGRLAGHLGKLARRAERLFGGPQDLEWAVSGGRVFLLQSRPITALPTGGGQQQDVWSNVGTGEVLPDVVTPMSWSVLNAAFQGIFDPILRHVGIDQPTTRWLGLVGGRVYMNVTTTVEILRSLPGPSTLELNEAFGGQQGQWVAALPVKTPNAKRSWSWLRLPRLSTFLVRVLFHATDRSSTAFMARWRDRANELTRVDVSALSDKELGEFIPGYLSRVGCWAGDQAVAAAALGSIGTGLGCAVAVFRLCRKWLSDADGSVANRLLSGAGSMDSAESALDMWRLAAWAREQPWVARILLGPGKFVDAREELDCTAIGKEFIRRWQDFMSRHGHHTRGEMDVHNPRWAETPDYVFDLVRSYLQMSKDADPLKLQSVNTRQRQQVLAESRRRLRNPLKRWIFSYLVHKGRRGLAARENCKSDGVRMLVPIRRALLESGRRLAERGILHDPDDVFFLELTELTSVLAGRETFDLSTAIVERKAEYTVNRGLTPPPVVVGRFDPKNCVPELVDENRAVLRGLAVSPGVVTGRARVLLNVDGGEQVRPGEILVAPYSDPGWTPYFIPAAGIVMDLGGQLSHGSVLAREYGLPAVVNVRSATRIIRTGQLIQVDGHRGVVTITADGNHPG